MKKTIPFIVLIIFICVNLGLAQYSKAKDGIGARVYMPNFQYPIANNFEMTDFTGGLEIEYIRHLNNILNLGIPFRMANAKFPTDELGGVSEGSLLGIDALIQMKYFQESNIVYPYIYTGFGVLMEDFENISLGIPVGLGLNFRLGKHAYLSTKVEYRIGFDELRSNIGAGIGILMLIGPGAEEPPVITDRDGDNVPDNQDLCPDIAGLVGLNGCPDADGDGITDGDDNCPEVAGLAEFKGCPDTDGDGIADPEDQCPEAGGLPENNGCPPTDTDNDGVFDSEDECPTIPGLPSLRGCPDEDSDGVADKEDECPGVPGPIETNGCPDRDKDSVIDREDRCPDSPGSVANNGCPEIKKEDKEILEFATQAVQFETASSRLTSTSNDILDQIAEIMVRYTDYKLRISGHTDSIGSALKNQDLSENRAKSCYNYLISKGVEVSRISFAGYGETQPISNNKYKVGRDENRRVEFDIYLE